MSRTCQVLKASRKWQHQYFVFQSAAKMTKESVPTSSLKHTGRFSLTFGWFAGAAILSQIWQRRVLAASTMSVLKPAMLIMRDSL